MAPASKPPLFVIGTHRSGTTFLGRALSQHSEVAYWEEPRHVWSRGNNFRPDDCLAEADATPQIKARIRGQVARFLEKHGKNQLVEKTPSNCLRLPFIFAIFPDARFVHIHRDGRAVLSSTHIVAKTRAPDREWYLRRLLGTPLWEWPSFIPRAWNTLGHRLLGREMAYWGPRPQGWKSWVAHDPKIVVLAKQWRYTLEPVLNFRPLVPQQQWLEVEYQDLVSQPQIWADKLQRFADLSPDEDFKQSVVNDADPTRTNVWRQLLTDRNLEMIRPILEPPLLRLGYSWELPSTQESDSS